jgi:serine/threonine protein kinase
LIIAESQGDLFDEMKRTLGRMPEAQLVTSVLLPMMSALLAMHSLGFIHRDIKPENTLFAAGRVLKLAGGLRGACRKACRIVCVAQVAKCCLQDL